MLPTSESKLCYAIVLIKRDNVVYFRMNIFISYEYFSIIMDKNEEKKKPTTW